MNYTYYITDVFNTNTTSPIINDAIQNAKTKLYKEELNEEPINFSLSLKETKQVLLDAFTSEDFKLDTLEVYSNYLEMYLSMLNKKNNFVFGNYDGLNVAESFLIENEAGVYTAFTYTLIMYIAKYKNCNPKDVIENVVELLKSKNKKYGNAAIEPARIFAQSNNIEQIKVRIDDKLNRLKQGTVNDDEDVYQDLLGYMILLNITTEFLWEIGQNMEQ